MQTTLDSDLLAIMFLKISPMRLALKSDVSHHLSSTATGTASSDADDAPVLLAQTRQLVCWSLLANGASSEHQTAGSGPEGAAVPRPGGPTADKPRLHRIGRSPVPGCPGAVRTTVRHVCARCDGRSRTNRNTCSYAAQQS